MIVLIDLITSNISQKLNIKHMSQNQMYGRIYSFFILDFELVDYANKIFHLQIIIEEKYHVRYF